MRYYPQRIAWAVRQWTRRWQRWRTHLSANSPTYWSDFLWLTLDLFFVPDVYELFAVALAPNIRSLTSEEITLARCVYGDSLPYALVRLDERAVLGTRRYAIAYVSFLTVNSYGTIGPTLLMHELIHCWQYTHRGAAYIPRALWAQRTAFGYDYRGVAHLRTLGHFFELNYEQQGDVVSDFYRLSAGESPRWGRATGGDLPVYADLLADLQNGKKQTVYGEV